MSDKLEYLEKLANKLERDYWNTVAEHGENSAKAKSAYYYYNEAYKNHLSVYMVEYQKIRTWQGVYPTK